MGRTSDARQRLMDAASELIWEFSYGAVTIEAICDRAAVKKGSFYYFFDSKSELALAALDAWWIERKALLERVFHSNLSAPDRLREYLDFVAGLQLKFFTESGQVLGCPICVLGAEICTQDAELRSRVREIIKGITAYFEAAIAESQSLGQIEGTDAAKKANTLFSYHVGVLIQARIENDADAIRHLGRNALEMIGARSFSLSASRNTGAVRPARLPLQLARSA